MTDNLTTKTDNKTSDEKKSLLPIDQPTTEDLSPLCQSNCKTCNSLNLLEIHKLRVEKKMEFRILSKKLLADYSEQISHSALCQHFKHYRKYLKKTVQGKMIKYLDEELDQRAQHGAKLTTLINATFKKLAIQWENFTPDIGDLEKVMKLKYLVMEGKVGVGDVNDELATIIKNSEKVNLTQLTLFMPQSTPIEKKAEVVSE
jgi:hypothetical protein